MYVPYYTFIRSRAAQIFLSQHAWKHVGWGPRALAVVAPQPTGIFAGIQQVTPLITTAGGIGTIYPPSFSQRVPPNSSVRSVPEGPNGWGPGALALLAPQPTWITGVQQITPRLTTAGNIGTMYPPSFSQRTLPNPSVRSTPRGPKTVLSIQHGSVLHYS